jgi:hypothetical protein
VRVWRERSEVGRRLVIRVSFVLPAGQERAEYGILYWDQTANGWVEVSSQKVQAWLEGELVWRQQAWVNQAGLYILVKQGG